MTDNNQLKVGEPPLTSDEFAQKLIELKIFKLLMTTLPEFCNDYDSMINFVINAGKESNGVGIDLSISNALPDEQNYQVLFNRLKKMNRLLEIEFLVPELKKSGASSDYIDILLKEGENIVKNLYDDNYFI